MKKSEWYGMVMVIDGMVISWLLKWLQRRNGNKCRCECLKINKCDIGYSWDVNNCRCEMKKLAALIEECDVETDEI